jgi:hypothetical protein
MNSLPAREAICFYAFFVTFFIIFYSNGYGEIFSPGKLLIT